MFRGWPEGPVDLTVTCAWCTHCLDAGGLMHKPYNALSSPPPQARLLIPLASSGSTFFPTELQNSKLSSPAISHLDPGKLGEKDLKA